MGIHEVISAPSSFWQNPYVERLIGSVRRECLNHVIVFNEVHLRRTLAGYISYHHRSRTRLSLAKDAPTPRRVQAVNDGDVIAFLEVGGLHHRRYRIRRRTGFGEGQVVFALDRANDVAGALARVALPADYRASFRPYHARRHQPANPAATEAREFTRAASRDDSLGCVSKKSRPSVHWSEDVTRL
jgi:integrase-like protein